MKHLAHISTIVATVLFIIAPGVVKSQSITQGFPVGGSASTTTYYLPSTDSNLTTTVTTPVGGNVYQGTNFPNSNGTYYGSGSSTTTTPIYQNIYPGTNLFPNSSDNNYYGGGTNRQGYDRPSVIIQQNDPYPRAAGSSCSTSIVGSPIPSPVAIDRYSGQPCR